ncbi:MAG: carbohydrate binding family 9 domain-containing protein [SAR92 clade bacterium]|nr:carbohydrate binding family 9 domain-containing protein [SAR92 clade bacterium]
MSKNPCHYLLLVILSYLVVPVSFGAITVDGLLNEPEWADARVYSDFVTVEPLTSEPAKYVTEVRLITNEEGIFVGFTNYQPASVKRINRRFARDADIKADRVMVGIDFDGTAESAYDFTVGSANSRQDGVMGGGTHSTDWDGTWYSQTSSDKDYWYSEIHIPWTVAPMSDAGGGTKNMAFWFSRVVYNESLRFAFPNAFYTRSTFMEDWHPIEVKQVKASTLDWFPYASYNHNLRGSDDTDDANVGLDFIWRPNSNTQLTGALNPDFGQVESDDLVVNFSAFETFVSEKRAFFTENQGLFNSAQPNEDVVLYTRRIGAGVDKGLLDVDVAAKLTHYGKTVDMGLFAVKEDTSGESAGGEFISSRIQRKSNNLAVGHRLTHVTRNFLEREATVQGVDVRWDSSDKVRVAAQILHSDIHQKANNNNDYQSVDQQDYAGWVNWSYTPSDEWSHALYYSHYGDEFEMNDMGYMRRNGYDEFYGYHRYDQRKYDQESSLLSGSTEFAYSYLENTAGKRLSLWSELKLNWVFKSTRKISADFETTSSGWDDRITRGNESYFRPAKYKAGLRYESPRGNDFVFSAKVYAGTEDTGELYYGAFIRPELYLTETLTLGGRVGFKKYREWLLWDSEVSQLAGYETDRYSGDIRLDWYPSNRQEVRVKFQWIGLDAEVINSYQLDNSGDLQTSGTESSSFSISDTAFQIRYRYQLAPLSDIFLVYSRGGFFGSDSGDKGPRTLFNEGWSGVQVESLIAKIRYRF